MNTRFLRKIRCLRTRDEGKMQGVLLKRLHPVTESRAGQMAEWNAYYQNEDEEQEQEDAELSGGKQLSWIN